MKEYLYHLAFKMYPATQYMRHELGALYNFEPDLIHDVFGHVSAFFVPQIHALHHKAGLAAIGVSEAERELIAAVLWYTFEMGLCQDEKDSKRHLLLGGSLFSSVDECQRALAPDAKIFPLGELSALSYKDI